MNLRIWLFTFLCFWAGAVESECNLLPPEVLADNLFPTVRLETSRGDIVVELNRMRAPAAVNNFLRYVLDGSYDGTIFHRVIPEFVVQGGGYTESFEERPNYGPVINESGNGLTNAVGTIAMARFSEPHSATRQFYFNLGSNANLDPGGRSWGYTVFGDVIEGFDVLNDIASVPTDYSEQLDAPDVPVEPVVLKQISVISP